MTKERKLNITIVFWATLIIIIVVWLLNLFLLKTTDSFRSSFGAMYGAVSALFSGLALAGIIITILLQREELALQRQELVLTRDELKRSADSQEKSEKALNRQAENLKISAKLSALNTLVSYYSEIEQHVRNGTRPYVLKDIIDKKDGYVRRIEEILERKELYE